MSKGRHLSRHQQGIVNRYYEHLDTITITRLQELVSELYLETSPRKLDQLWKRVEKALERTDATEPRVRRILDERDLEQLAALIGELS